MQSDTVAQGYGLLGLMTSVLLTPDGKTVEGRSRLRHGDPPLSRAPEGQGDLDQLDRVDLRPGPVALAHRAKLDNNPEPAKFATTL